MSGDEKRGRQFSINVMKYFKSMDVLTREFEIALTERHLYALKGTPREKTLADTKSPSMKYSKKLLTISICFLTNLSLLLLILFDSFGKGALLV